jgi:hypothetical protein
MFLFPRCLLFAAALSLLLPSALGLHFLAEKGKPWCDAPSRPACLPACRVSQPQRDASCCRCFFEDLAPNVVVVVNYVHKHPNAHQHYVAGEAKTGNPLMKATVKSEQNDVLCAPPPLPPLPSHVLLPIVPSLTIPQLRPRA